MTWIYGKFGAGIELLLRESLNLYTRYIFVTVNWSDSVLNQLITVLVICRSSKTEVGNYFLSWAGII